MNFYDLNSYSFEHIETIRVQCIDDTYIGKTYDFMIFEMSVWIWEKPKHKFVTFIHFNNIERIKKYCDEIEYQEILRLIFKNK